MKTDLIKIWLMILFVIVSSNGFAAEKVVIAVGEWPPYSSEDLKHYGYTNRVIKEAFAFSHIETEFLFLPWARGYEIAKAGEMDGTAVYMRTPEREKVFYYSDSVMESQTVFFHLKNYFFDWKNFDDLKNIDIGATIGYSYGEAFDQAEKSERILVERVPSDLINFRKLLQGRVKLFAIPEQVGYSFLYKEFPDQAHLVTHHPRPVIATTSHLIFTKAVGHNKRLLKLFNKGLKNLRETGKYDQYLEESRKENYIKK